MMPAYMPPRLIRFVEHSVLTTDFARAVRSSVAFILAWAVCLWTGHPAAAVYAATAAQNLTLLDVRGDYRARLAILLTMTVVMAASAFAGTLTGNNVVSASLMMGALALLGGAWRHLSGDYGPNLAVISTLLFLIALSQPGDARAGGILMTWVAVGCAGGILLQLGGWCFRPQHPLRHAVAECWVAASDLIMAIRAESSGGIADPQDLAAKEIAVRTTVDGTLTALDTDASKKRGVFSQHLDDATHIAARLATRVSAFHTALENIKRRPDFGQAAATLDSLLLALANTARSSALTLLGHRPEQFIALEVRVRRCAHLLSILDGRLSALPDADADVARARRMLAQIGELLPVITATLGATVDHGAAHVTWALRLPDLSGLTLRSLSSWLNPAPQLEPVLMRHALRLAVLTMLAVAVYKGFHIPRGYWIAFTVIIVLQPDYGSTRQKAGQRIVGTVAGCLLGSVLLWVKLPFALLLILAWVTAFFFAYFLKRRYGVAIFFVTLMLVLIMDAVEPLSWQFTLARLFSTVVGGLLALFAALVLWPQWEQDQFPKILAGALRANRDYLKAVALALGQGSPLAGAVLQKKREAERANGLASASLQRLLGEPSSQPDRVERAAALTAYNQRVTRAITVLALHLNAREPFSQPGLDVFTRAIGDALEALAAGLEIHPADLSAGRPSFQPPVYSPSPAASLIYGQLGKILTEIEAMSLVGDGLPPRPAHSPVVSAP